MYILPWFKKKEKKEIDLKSKLPSRWNVGILGFLFVFLIFWHGCSACGILVPQPGIKSEPLALEEASLHHWTTREAPGWDFERGSSCSSDSTPAVAASPSQPGWLETYVLQQWIPASSQWQLSQLSVFQSDFSWCVTPLRSLHPKIMHVASSAES